MAFEQSRSRRMYIMQQISIREKSKQKNQASSQKRRMIQTSFNEFRKTMSSFQKNKQENSINQKSQFSLTNKSRDNPFERSRKLREQYDEAMKIPSFRNLKYDKLDDSKSINEEKKNNKQQILQQSPLNILNELQQKQQKDQQLPKFNQIKIQQSSHKARQIQSPQKFSQNIPLIQSPQKFSKNNQVVQNNQSSSSALFFTSQFQEYLNQKGQQRIQSLKDINQKQQKIQSKQNLDQIQKIQQKKDIVVNQNIQSQNLIMNSPMQNYKTQRSQSNPNESVKKQQFQDKIYQNQNQHKNQHKKVHDPQTIQKQLSRNKSVHMSNASLVMSNSQNNSSLLKYSLAQSNFKQIKDVLNNKFKNQLILDQVNLRQQKLNQNQNDNNNQDQNIYVRIKIQNITDKVIRKYMKQTKKVIIQVAKLKQFMKNKLKRQKKQLFMRFLINKQLNFQQRKNQIKCDRLLQTKQSILIYDIFSFIKKHYYLRPLENLKKSQQHFSTRQLKLKQKIFRFLKIHWFDKKVIKQVQIYHLSKVFSSFKKVVEKQRTALKIKCLGQYCFWLKKRMFKQFQYAVKKNNDQRIKNQNARWHYFINLQRKVFQAWKQKCVKNDRYISLAMTMKNTFKQTKDHKWIQIKTVNFQQIK